MMPIADSAMRIVDNAEQRRDLESALHHCSALAAKEVCEAFGAESEHSFLTACAIIFKHMRNGREL